MKKTYAAPSAEHIALETEAVLEISYTGSGSLLDDSAGNNSSKYPATDFGKVPLF